MWLVVAIAAALVMLALIPLLVAGLIIAVDLFTEMFCQAIAWCIEAWHRALYRVCFAIGRTIRYVKRKVTR